MDDSPTESRGTVEFSSAVRLHYVVTERTDVAADLQRSDDKTQTVLLVHGYPQTSHQWRHVVGPLAAAGYRVIAADYRGAGFSSRPNTGYDKHTMAGDLNTLVREHLKISAPLVVVGHDIGSMVAYAFALQFPGDVSHLSLSEAPLPGTLAYDTSLIKTTLSGDPLWHFRFHNAPNNTAETFTYGRERQYISDFYDRLAFRADAIDMKARNVYANAFEAPGAMRAGFELYRAFDQDATDNKTAAKRNGRLRMPVLALAGEHSPLMAITKPMMTEIARHATVVPVPAAGHWIAEENPAFVVQTLVKFLRENPT